MIARYNERIARYRSRSVLSIGVIYDRRRDMIDILFGIRIENRDASIFIRPRVQIVQLQCKGLVVGIL